MGAYAPALDDLEGYVQDLLSLEKDVLAKLQPIFTQVQKEVEAALGALTAAGMGDKYTAAKLAQMKALMGIATGQAIPAGGKGDLGKGLKALGPKLKAAIGGSAVYAKGSDNAIGQIMGLSQTFSQLPFGQLKDAARLVDGHATAMEMHTRSLSKYGQGVIDDMRVQLAVGLAKGETVHQLTNRLANMSGFKQRIDATTPPGVAAKLGAKGMADRYRKQAERVARTETCKLYNLGAMDSIYAAHGMDNDVVKCWDASLDMRVCVDCKVLHGKQVAPDDLFPGGYFTPPAHPNCRCMVTAGHKGWADDAADEPMPPKPVKEKPAPEVIPWTPGIPADAKPNFTKMGMLGKGTGVEYLTGKGLVMIKPHTYAGLGEEWTWDGKFSGGSWIRTKSTQVVPDPDTGDFQVMHLSKAKVGKYYETTTTQGKLIKAPPEVVAKIQAAKAAKLEAEAAAAAHKAKEEAEAKLAAEKAKAAKAVKAELTTTEAGMAAWAKMEAEGVDMTMVDAPVFKQLHEIYAKSAQAAIDINNMAHKGKPGTVIGKTSKGFDIQVPHPFAPGASPMDLPADGGGMATPLLKKGLVTVGEGEIAGHGYVYKYMGGQWVQTAKPPGWVGPPPKPVYKSKPSSTAKIKARATTWTPPPAPALDPRRTGVTDMTKLEKALKAEPLHGVGVFSDGDMIEGGNVRVVKVVGTDGKPYYEASFKLTAPHGNAVAASLTGTGQSWGFRGRAVKGGVLTDTSAQGGAQVEVRRGTAAAQAVEIGREGALINQVRIRAGSLAELNAALDDVGQRAGGDLRRVPTRADVELQAKARLASKFDPAGFNAEIMACNTPEEHRQAIEASYETALARHPIMAKALADVQVTETYHGQQGLYSPALGEHMAKGVKVLIHDGNTSASIMGQIASQTGLMSSEARYTAGIFENGMSTDTDFGTGGAGGVFVRSVTHKEKADAIGSPGSGMRVLIDPAKALGRLDWWAFDGDRYGNAGHDYAEDRRPAGDMGKAAGGSNEVMLPRGVHPSAFTGMQIRSASDKKRIVEDLTRAGITQINGTPLDQFFTTGVR